MAVERSYSIYDVFTDAPLSGNPLAVVFDAEGLDTPAMQRIAGEFNLSETVFIFPPQDVHHTARLRIFTPRRELPFAGHPTVGAAIALAEKAQDGSDGADAASSILMLEETVGAVRCAVTAGNRQNFAEFDLPRLPIPYAFNAEPEAVAAALGLSHHEIGFENHTISGWSAGVPFICVPVADMEAAGRARLDPYLWEQLTADGSDILADAYVYCRETKNHNCDFHTRMFAPGVGIAEDPATGSAAAAFSGAILLHDTPVDGSHRFNIEQGVEMGRPSRIQLEIDVSGGKIEAARIGGGAVCVAKGQLFV